MTCTDNIALFYENQKKPTVSEISNWKGLHTDFQLINGKDLTNVSIIGRGNINGRGASIWWNKHKIRPYVIRLQNCKNVLFEGISIRESPFHSFNFTEVNGLIIREIMLRNDPKSPNTDGLHIVKSKNVRISGVDFETGDDCLLTPESTDIVVTNSRFKTPWGFWWPNRECSNITISNCVIDCQMLVKDFRGASNVIISNIVASGPGKLFTSYGGPLKNVLIDNLIANGWSQGGWFVNGENIVLSNVHIIRKPGSGNDILKNGFFFKNVNGLTLRNVSIDNVEKGAALYCNIVNGLEVEGFKSTGVGSDDPIMALSNVKDVLLHGNRGGPEMVLADISGNSSDDIRYFQNDWNGSTMNISKEIGLTSVQSIQAEVRSFFLPENTYANEKVHIETEVTNTDDRSGMFPLVMYIDGDSVNATTWIWLDRGETKKVLMETPRFYKPKKYRIRVGNLPEQELHVRSTPPELRILEVNLKPWDRIVKNGKVISMSASVKNIGSKTSYFDVVLSKNLRIVTKAHVQLDAGETQRIPLEFVPLESGLHELDINGQWNGSIKSYENAMESEFLHYSFESISGDTIFDSSGLRNSAFMKANKNGKKPVFITGIKDKAIHFNGESAYMEIPKLLLKYPMTISLWVKAGTLTPSSTAGRQMILYASEPMGNDGYGPEKEIHLMRATGDTYAFWTNASNKRLDLREKIEAVDKWDFLTIVYDESSKMYLNGKVVSEMSNIYAFDVEDFADRIYIGRPNVNYLRFFNGALDDLKFYSEALNAKDVMELYRSYLD